MISRVVLASLVISTVLSISGCKEAIPYYQKPKLDAAADIHVPAPDTGKLDTSNPDTPPRLDTQPVDSRLDTNNRDTTGDRAEDQISQPDLQPDLALDLANAETTPTDTGTDNRKPDTQNTETGSPDRQPDLLPIPDARDGGTAETLSPDVPGLASEVGDTAGAETGPCPEGETRNCPNSPFQATGVCQLGTQTCLKGSWGPCTGAIAPLGVEACNNQDDTCNGSVDEGIPTTTCGLGACANTVAACAAGSTQACTPKSPLSDTDTTCDGVDDNCNGIVDEGCSTCVYVAPSPLGNDSSATGTTTLPFATIQAAIAFANGAGDRPKRVCVAGAATCDDASAVYAGPLVIPQGISVQGGYATTNWTVCPSTTPGTALDTNATAGVTFTQNGANTSATTELSRFSIRRIAPASTETIAGVTVDGVSGVVLSNLSITDEPNTVNTYAVNILSGASVSVVRSTLYAGSGTTDAIAVRVDSGTLSLRENCATIDASNRCTGTCNTATMGLFGRKATARGEGSRTYGLWLGDAAGSLIQTNSVCGGNADSAAAIRVAGTATGVVVRGNVIENAGVDKSNQAIRISSCGGASPLVTANTLISATTSSGNADVDAIYSTGACHPVIENNARIEVNGAGNGTLNAINCLAGSRCAILNNPDIRGLAPSGAAKVVGVRCDGEDSCARVANNTIRTSSGKDLVGVLLTANNTVVTANTITGGCAKTTATGVVAQLGSRATIAGNSITASDCATPLTSVTKYRGVQIIHDGSQNEPVVTGNTINPVGLTGTDCTSQAIDLSASLAGSSAAGTFTGNVLYPGVCNTAFGFVESGELHTRILTGNNFVPGTGASPTLYSRGGLSVGDIAAVNALSAGTSASDNTSTSPI